MKRTNPDFLNGVPELLVLQILSERELYGYDLVKAIRLRSGNEFKFGEGNIYPLLHSLAAAKELVAREDIVSGRRRFYYKITPKGRRKLKGMSDRWSTVVAAVSSALKGQHV